jgi:polyhydroxybutyrate depolymerase
VVLNFHGFTSDPFQEALLSGMNAAAEARGMIVAYPAGIANSWNAGQCCGLSAWTTMVDDVRFVRDAIDAIGREYCVDGRRVFATGMSNGGFLSHRLACEASDRIAAIAPVAGVLGVLPCLPRRPVPVLHFHGTLDPLVAYYGLPLGFASVPATFAGWQLRERCLGPERVTYERGDARCVARDGCEGGSEVILCTVDRGGHTWPGGLPVPLGYTTRNLDATAMMLDFFARHPMP